MPKNNQIGFLVDNTMANQLSYNLIKNINDYLENSSDDIVLFFENSTTSILPPNFSLMSTNEIIRNCLPPVFLHPFLCKNPLLLKISFFTFGILNGLENMEETLNLP